MCQRRDIKHYVEIQCKKTIDWNKNRYRIRNKFKFMERVNAPLIDEFLMALECKVKSYEGGMFF